MKKVKCPVCGQKNSAGRTVCEFCESPLPVTPADGTLGEAPWLDSAPDVPKWLQTALARRRAAGQEPAALRPAPPTPREPAPPSAMTPDLRAWLERPKTPEQLPAHDLIPAGPVPVAARKEDGPNDPPPAWLGKFHGRELPAERLGPTLVPAARASGAKRDEEDLPEWLGHQGGQQSGMRPRKATPSSATAVPKQVPAVRPPDEITAQDLRREDPLAFLDRADSHLWAEPAEPAPAQPSSAAADPAAARQPVQPLRPEDIDNLFIELPDWLDDSASDQQGKNGRTSKS